MSTQNCSYNKKHCEMKKRQNFTRVLLPKVYTLAI